MTVQVVNASGAYRVALATETWRTGALVVAPLIDEWTQDAPPAVTARTKTPRTYAHVAGGCLVVTGVAEQALPTLDAAPADVEVELRRVGHAPQPVTITIPMGSALPFEPPAVAVSSARILLSGRVTASAFPKGPISGATLEFAGTGRALVTLNVPLALPHRVATTVRGRTLTPGGNRTLDGPIAGGDIVVRLSSTASIGNGTILAIGDDIVVVEDTTGRLALLRTPVAASAGDGTSVRIQILGATGSSVALDRDALAGDALLPVSGALAASVVEVVDGNATEYRRTELRTDADGRWRLPGVRGIPEIDLTTSAAGFIADGPRRVPLAPLDPFIVNTSLRT